MLTTYSASAASVNLTWSPNTEADIAGYKIWYSSGSSSFTPIDVGNVTTASVPNLADGGLYTFYATAYNTAGLESAPSASITYTVPGGGSSVPPPVSAPVFVTQPAGQTLLAGNTLSLSVLVSDPAGVVYQWYFNSTPLPGATAASLQVANIQQSQAGSYTVRASNLGGSTLSSSASVVVNVATSSGKPVYTSQPSNQTVALGAPFTISAQVTGTLPISFQWYRNGYGIPGANAYSYSVSAAKASDEGVYLLSAGNSQGFTFSQSILITVAADAPSILVPPAGQVLTAGNVLTLSVQASGASPLTYQWYRDGSPIGNATSASYSVSSAQTSDSGTYTVKVANSAGSVISPGAAVVVQALATPAPVIQTQPLSQTVKAGATVNFSVAASGSSLQYQWLKNASSIPGATSANLQLSSVSAFDAGNYSVNISNAGGEVTSSPAVLQVIIPPSITQQPLNQTVLPDAAVTLSVKAQGSTPMRYQWFRKGSAIAGALTDTYTITAAQSSDAASYNVQVSNDAGSITSSDAIITVLTPPSIDNQPASQTVNAGTAITLSVGASGSAPLQYQWLKNGSPIPGANSYSFTIGSAGSSDAGAYSVKVSNPAGSVTSGAAAISVLSAPAITSQPANENIVAGLPLSVFAQATGSGPLSYQWYRDGIPIPGANSASYQVSAAQTSDSGSYTLKVSNSAGSVVSQPAVITVLAPPSILIQPQSQVLALGATATLSVTADGTRPMQYQWYHNGAAIPGGASDALNLSGLEGGDAGSYMVKVSNAAGIVSSSPALLTILTRPSIVVQPQSATVAPGASVTLWVQASGSTPLSYQWTRNESPIPNATGASLQITSVSSSDVAVYSVIVSNAAGSVTSELATVALIGIPSITSQPLDQTAVPGEAVILTVTAAGPGPLSYQWFFNGIAIPGAASSTFQIANVQAVNAGSYAVKVTNPGGSVSSAPAEIVVLAPPVITTHPLSQSVNLGSTISVSVVANGSTPLQYQWLKNGLAIPGASSPALTLANAQSTDAGNYSVKVSNAAGSITSLPAAISVIVPPSITKPPLGQTLLVGETLNISVQANGTGPLKYQWYRDGTPLASANAAAFRINSVQQSDAGRYRAEVSNAAGAVTSSDASIAVLVLPSITLQPAGQSVTRGSPVTLTAQAGGSAPLSYQWLRNGAPLPGATSSTLIIDSADETTVGSYALQVSNPAGLVTSSPAEIVLLEKPVITSQPLGQKVELGDAFTLTVVAASSTPLSYQWYLNDAPLPRQTNDAYTVIAAESYDIGNYSVKVSNAAGDTLSTVASIILTGQPEITLQPASQSAPLGGSVTFTVTANGTSPITYRWFRDGKPLQGANSPTLRLSRLQTDDQGSYVVEVSNPAGTTASAPAQLTLLTAPTITGHPAGQTLPEGSSLLLSVQASGSTPLQYQWFRNSAAIPGETSSTYQIAAVQATDSAAYSVKVSNSVGTASSYPAIVEVVVSPEIIQQPASQSLAAGSTLTLSIAASGSEPLVIQWFRNDLPLPGATNALFQLAAIKPADAGAYYARVSNLAGTAESDTAAINVLGAPVITQQPVSQNVTEGSSVTLTAGISGSSPFQYRWSKNGAPLPNASGPTLLIPSMSSADAAAYAVTVSNAAGSVTSNPATLTLVTGPAITGQPQGKTVAPGASVTFSVTATGSGPLQYQWFFNGSPIPNARGETWVINSARPGDAGSYGVKVSNSAGTASSSPATLVVLSAPVISSQPSPVTLSVGAPLTLAVDVTGSAPFQYQWHRDGAPIPNVTSAIFRVNSAQPADAGVYSVTISNPAGTVTSDSARVTLITPPVITQQPAGQTVAAGASVTLRVSAAGTTPLTYQWYRNGALVAGGTTASLQLPNVRTDQAGSYTVQVSNAAGSVTSDPAYVTIYGMPEITSQPQGTTVNPGASASFSVTAASSGSLQYQWFFNGAALPSATSATLLINSVKSSDAGSYLVKISNAAGTVSSVPASLTVLSAPAISSQPASTTVAAGSTLSLAVQASGSTPLQFQWYREGAPIPNATAATLQINNVQKSDAGAYWVTVSNSAGSVTSVPARVTVLVAPSITQQPASQSIAAGSSVTLSVSATGSAPLAYQWYRNNAAIPGATSPLLQLPGVQAADAASYSVQVSNGAGSISSDAAYLSVIGLPQITVQPQSQTVTGGAAVSLSVQASGSGLQYQWFKNGVALSGQSSPALYIASAQAADAGSYTVQISNAAGTIASSPAVVAINSPITITTQPASQTIALNTPFTLSVAAAGSSQLQYQWLRNGIALPNAKSATLQIASAQPTDAGSYTVTVSSPLGSTASDAAVITVLTLPAIIQQPSPQNLASGATLNLSVQYTGSGPMQLQWYKNGTAIPNATSATLQISNLQASDAGAYFVVLANAVGKATSTTANITVNTLAAPVITKQPVSVTAREGDPAAFSVQATGSGTLMYQWFRNGLPIAGATSSNYTFTASSSRAGLYNVTVGNSLGTIISADVTLTVKSQAAASALSLSVELNRLTVNATGGSNLLLRALGKPGQSYALQSTSRMPATDWETIDSAAADATGLIEFRSSDPSRAKAGFYRLIAE